MASGPITSWQIDGETMETVRDFTFFDSKITVDGGCSHEIKRHLLLGRKAMTNLDSILKSRDINILTKVHIVKAMLISVAMDGCECWTIKKFDHQRIDTFELWCWRTLLNVPWTARRSNQSIQKEINPDSNIPMNIGRTDTEAKLQQFVHLMQMTNSLAKILMLVMTEGRKRRGGQRLRSLNGITDPIHMSLSKLREIV